MGTSTYYKEIHQKIVLLRDLELTSDVDREVGSPLVLDRPLHVHLDERGGSDLMRKETTRGGQHLLHGRVQTGGDLAALTGWKNHEVMDQVVILYKLCKNTMFILAL